jgi:SAM-dependent methyltransferase
MRGRLAEYRRSRRAWRRFWESYRGYRALAPPDRLPSGRLLYPCPGEDGPRTEIEPTYFYQDSWAFERIVRRRPDWHVDVGSHHKYVALLSKVVRTIMIDIRPLSLPLDSLEFRRGTILAMPFDDASVPSVSSLCVVEHIGLGRYGDPLDPYGTEKAVAELQRIVQPGGRLYLSVPLHDTNRTYFNAHRAFEEEYFLSLCRPFLIEERRYIYGREFCDARRPGFGVACYELRRPPAGDLPAAPAQE